MRTLRLSLVGTVILALLGGLGGAVVSLAAAQEPSPDPAPWFGEQRVEFPDHGFAVTVPEGWIGFSPTDPAGQVEAAAPFILDDFVTWWLPKRLEAMAGRAQFPAVEGFDITTVGAEKWASLTLDPVEEGHCEWGTAPRMAIPDYYAWDSHGEHPIIWFHLGETLYEPAQPIELPAGGGHLLRGAPFDVSETGVFTHWLLVLELPEAALVVSCENRAGEPDDDWLPSFETIEILPTQD
jgi:hypothetical protein